MKGNATAWPTTNGNGVGNRAGHTLFKLAYEVLHLVLRLVEGVLRWLVASVGTSPQPLAGGGATHSPALALQDKHPLLPVDDEEVDLPLDGSLVLEKVEVVVDEEVVAQPRLEGVVEGALRVLSLDARWRNGRDHLGHGVPRNTEHNSCARDRPAHDEGRREGRRMSDHALPRLGS
jgi:hypothetical protein